MSYRFSKGEEDSRTIILRHPPESARGGFYQLKAEHARLVAEAKAAAANVNQALESKAEARLNASEIESPDRPRTAKDWQISDAKRQAQKEFGKSAARTDSAVEFESAAARRLHQFDKRGYDLEGDFKFFGYALKTGEFTLYGTYGGLPIYDCGILGSR